MTGTSGDGADAALTEITGRAPDLRVRLIAHHHVPYDPAVRAALFELRDRGQFTFAKLAHLGRAITLSCASAVRNVLRDAKITAPELTAVAAHGQTLYHEPPDTIQWLDPALLAAEVGSAVVSDFRRADLAAGGQGAPLVPFADYLLFRDARINRVALNLGGIANITVLPAGCTPEQVVAFDTGPGNCLSDWVCRTFGSSGAMYDADGAGASQGTVVQSIASAFLAEAYFTAPAPKSTDGPQMIEMFRDRIAEQPDRPPLNDLLATTTYLAAECVHRAVAAQPTPTDELIVSGGGLHNRTMVGWIKKLLPASVRFRTVDEFGIAPSAKEALAFALLAAATLDRVPSNLPSVTGAKRAVILGSITPRP